MACILLVACKNLNTVSPKSTINNPTATSITGNLVSITPLPFGIKPTDLKNVHTYKAFNDNAGEKPLLGLPLIKATKYFFADNENLKGMCYDIPINENIKLVNYQYQLPDYNGFQIYYMSGNPESSATLKDEFSIDCNADYGNLIVYNTKLQTAAVLTIYYNFYIDSAQQRYFYIDEKFNIYMADEFSTDAENDKEENNPQKVYLANITNEGIFSTKVIFDPDE